MPRHSCWILAGLLLINGELSAFECPTFDTAIAWRNDLTQAAVEAKSEDRILLVMHLSGNLAKTAFT